MTGLSAMLDTNIVSDLIRNPRGKIASHVALVGVQNICVSVLTAAELRYGAAKKASPRLISDIDGALDRILVVNFEPPADVVYASIRDTLSKAGTPIGPMDYLIAAHAISLDLTLITANVGEFSRVPGLKVENWLD